GLIPGSQIKNHSIPAKKLTKSAIKSLRGRRGPAGPKGATGPQGPGGQIVTYDAKASASAPKTTLGTFLGDTISASCSTPAAPQAARLTRAQAAPGADPTGPSPPEPARATPPGDHYTPANRPQKNRANGGRSETGSHVHIEPRRKPPG